jgi:hypothetical protein
MKRPILLAILIVAALPLQAAEPTLDSLKQAYETEVQKIADAHDSNLSRLLDTYERSVGRAVQMLKKKGDPDTVLRALTEKRRFEQERTVPAEPNAELPRLMQDVQAFYLKAVGKADAEMSKAIADFVPKYIAALERLMKALTAQEKLDLALNVKEEKQRVEFMLADMQVHQPTAPAKEEFPVNLKRGLVLYYGFDKNDGERVSDKSGHGNYGEVRGATWVSGGRTPGNGACRFSGKEQEGITSSKTLNYASFTFAVWVRGASVASGKEGVLGSSNWRLVGEDGDGEPWLSGRGLEFAYRPSAKQRMGVGAAIPNMAKWIHCVGIWDSPTITLYIDGKKVRASDIGRKSFGSGRLAVGRKVGRDVAMTESLRGIVDDVMIWNRAVSDAEVEQLYGLVGGR